MLERDCRESGEQVPPFQLEVFEPRELGVLVQHFFTMMPAVASSEPDPGEAALSVGLGLEVGTQATCFGLVKTPPQRCTVAFGLP